MTDRVYDEEPYKDPFEDCPIELRWLVTLNKVTSDDVRAYRYKNSVPMSEARRILANRTGPVLQYSCDGGREWRNVRTTTITNDNGKIRHSHED